MALSDARIADALIRLAEARGPDKSFCPSEAARMLDENWRVLMPDVRRVAAQIGLRASQKGVPVNAETARGPIRLSLPSGA